MSEELDKKIESLVIEAEALLGTEAERYKLSLEWMLTDIDNCDFVRATRNLISISNDLDEQAKIFIKSKVGEPDGIPLDNLSSRISRGVRLESETIEAFKFLLKEKCGCKLR